MKEEIREALLKAGASAVGFAEAGMIDDRVHDNYKKWIEEDHHGEMTYLQRHIPLRRYTDSVLKGARTVISMAFSYAPEEWLSIGLPLIPAYAYGEDYHNVIRELINPCIRNFKEGYGGDWRLCIDSAPVAERYWALKAGIGKKGLNGSIIVEGCGSCCFLAEILTTLEFEPDIPITDTSCRECGKCVEICPSKAINKDSNLDAKRCINYLCIEKKGEFTTEEKEILRQSDGFLAGCDLCLRICPHNSKIKPSSIFQFKLKQSIKTLTPKKILSLEEAQFKKEFADSPLLYISLPKLKYNIQSIKS